MAKKTMQWAMSRGWIQDQHGAWPMALLPIIVGSSLAGWRPIHGLLLVTWLAGFHLFNVCSLWAKVRKVPRRRGRYIPAMGVWAALTAACGVVVVALHPQILWWGVFFAPLIGVAVWEAWRKNERALAARASSIIASTLMLPVAVWISEAALVPSGASASSAMWLGSVAESWASFASSLRFEHVGVSGDAVWGVTGVLGAYFLATVPYVRSLIRGRNDRRWLVASVLFHLMVATVVTGVWVWGASFASLPLSVVWWLLTLRAAVVPWAQMKGVSIRPVHIGIGEFVTTGFVVGALWWALSHTP